MDADLRSRVPLEPQALKSFFQGVERSRYDTRDDFFGLNFSAQRVLSNFAWDVYSYNAYLCYARARKPTQEPEVSKSGLHHGHLSAEQTRLLQDIFASCEEKPLDPFAFRSGDHSLGVDPYVGLDLEEEGRPSRSMLDRLKAWGGVLAPRRPLRRNVPILMWTRLEWPKLVTDKKKEQ